MSFRRALTGLIFIAACGESGMPLGNDALGIARFEIDDGAQQTTITGFDADRG